jgi:Domain of unknown function (DUF1772)
LDTVVEVLRFINVFAAGIVAGGQMLVLLTTARIIRGLAPSLSIQMHQAILDDHADRHMPPAALIAVISGAVILILHHQLTHTSGAFTTAGVVCALGVALVSLSLVQRSNQQIRRWSEGSAVDAALVARRAWDRAQVLRTTLGVAALACFIIGALS